MRVRVPGPRERIVSPDRMPTETMAAALRDLADQCSATETRGLATDTTVAVLSARLELLIAALITAEVLAEGWDE